MLDRKMNKIKKALRQLARIDKAINIAKKSEQITAIALLESIRPIYQKKLNHLLRG